jgi:deazaflavin-dependent oxidoreductase (nitroreductase family)
MSERFPVRGPVRWLLRLPIWLYRLRLGWLLGDHFLLLTHTGRRSGRRYQTVLEVVWHDRADDTYVVPSGWGERSDWLRNLEQAPVTTITVGARRRIVRAERLPIAEAEHFLRDYARRHPFRFRELARLLAGLRADDPAATAARLARRVPLVALRPHP